MTTERTVRAECNDIDWKRNFRTMKADAEKYGTMWEAKRVIEPLLEYGECWTHAWRYAVKHNVSYCEGIAVFEPEFDDRLHAHAWCLDADGTVIEQTEYYENTIRYFGFVVMHPVSQKLITPMDEWGQRDSVLHAMLYSGPKGIEAYRQLIGVKV